MTGRAKILSPRWRCWRCQGRRLIVISTYPIMEYVPCPSCHETDPTPAGKTSQTVRMFPTLMRAA
jgi:hypothetical protein